MGQAQATAAPNGSVPFPLSGSDILKTRTEGPKVTLFMSWGVIRIYCFLSEVLAVSIIIFILMRRLTASINTSNSSENTMDFQQTVDVVPPSRKLHTKAAQRAPDTFPQRKQ